MAAADLNLSTVELTSTLRTAPLNGQASSTEYNESQRETIVDLTSLADFINNTLLPLLNALPAGALEPPNVPVGIEGRTINTDTSDRSALFFDSLTSSPLTIANSLRIINGIVTTLSQQLIDMGVQVASLQARLASTNQNDIALALQNLSSALNQISVNQQIQNTEITEIQGALVIRLRSAPIVLAAGSTTTTVMVFAASYPDNAYTCTTGVECTDSPSPLVVAGGIQKNGTGVGVTVGIANFDTVAHTVILHVMSSHD